MAIPFHKDLITLDGIKKSILNDKYVYSWFAFLLMHPKAQERVAVLHDLAETRQSLVHMKKAAWVYNIIFLFSIMLYLQSFNHLYIFTTVMMGYLLFYDHKEKKAATAEISARLITMDYEEEQLGKMTLFQLCEQYARRYSMISLVDAIYRLDKIYRMTLMLAFVFVCYVILLDQWWLRYLLLLILYLIVVYLSNQPFFYKKLK